MPDSSPSRRPSAGRTSRCKRRASGVQEAERRQNEQVQKESERRGRLALDAAGLAAAYEAWATAPDRTFAERAFIQRAGHWARDDATLLSAATTLGLSAADVDELFELAATL